MMGHRTTYFAWWISPSLLFYSLFMILPVALILKESVWHNGPTLGFYVEIIRDPGYARILLNTIRISFLVALGCSALSYPFATILYGSRGRRFRLVYLVFSIPLVVNPLALLYAWMVILQREGVINFVFLHVIRFSHPPFQLLYNGIGVVVPMIYLLVPYSVLLTYASMVSVERSLIRSALNLGSSKVQLFRRILLPLSLPGFLAGGILVFALAMGYFVTPALLGGLRETMISMIIERQMNTPAGWGIASALTVSLLLAMVVLSLAAARLLAPHRLWRRFFSHRF